jgi:hypothetical protein
MEERLTKREQPQHAHVWRGCRTRATTEYNWCGTTNIVTSTFRPVPVPVSVPVSGAAVSIAASATEAVVEPIYPDSSLANHLTVLTLFSRALSRVPLRTASLSLAPSPGRFRVAAL